MSVPFTLNLGVLWQDGYTYAGETSYSGALR